VQAWVQARLRRRPQATAYPGKNMAVSPAAWARNARRVFMPITPSEKLLWKKQADCSLRKIGNQGNLGWFGKMLQTILASQGL
jgi:hypothetical protein